MFIKSEWITFEEYRNKINEINTNNMTLYHRPLWLNAVVNGFGVKIRAICSTNEHSDLLAITPFMVMKKGPLRVLGTPLSGMFTEFSGPIFDDSLDKLGQSKVFESQHKLALQVGWYIEWGEKGSKKEGGGLFEPLRDLGYTYYSRPTILVDLSGGEDKVWDNFRGRARNMIRKSVKARVIARFVEPTEGWVQNYYDMLKATFERQGCVVPHPLSFYQEIIGIAAAGKARCVVAEVDGRMIAAAIFLIDQSRMLYLSGTANSEGMKLAASSLIQWYAIREAIQSGVSIYDMGGLGIPSIDKFKRSFGGEEVNHHRWQYRSLLFKIIGPISLWAVRNGWIRLWGK